MGAKLEAAKINGQHLVNLPLIAIVLTSSILFVVSLLSNHEVDSPNFAICNENGPTFQLNRECHYGWPFSYEIATATLVERLFVYVQNLVCSFVIGVSGTLFLRWKSLRSLMFLQFLAALLLIFVLGNIRTHSRQNSFARSAGIDCYFEWGNSKLARIVPVFATKVAMCSELILFASGPESILGNIPNKESVLALQITDVEQALVLDEFTSLAAIDLSWANFISDDEGILVDAVMDRLTSHRGIRGLNLKGVSVAPRHIQRILGLKQLEILDISSNDSLTASDIQLLLELPNLKVLYVDDKIDVSELESNHSRVLECLITKVYGE
jgi:hypothetical protein